MIIREGQMDAFREAGARGFEVRMLERIRTHFPKHEKYVGEPQLLVLVGLARQRAESYALTAERSIALYLDLMCVLGSEFDTDPQFPWAAALLADRSFPTQAGRIDALHSQGWEFANKAAADFRSTLDNREQSPLISGFSEIRQKSLDEVTPETARSTAAEIAGNLKNLFPAKCSSMGEECIQLLVRKAMASATGYGICNTRGIWLFAALMFVVGAGFDRDPQLPWASQILADKSIPSPAERTNRLYTEAVTALKRWWSIDTGAQA